MDLIKVVVVLLRRWYVVIPILVIGTGASFVIARGIPPEYTATGLIIVVDSTSNGGVSASALAESVQDGDTMADVTGGGAATYRVGASGDGILRVVADAETAQEAVRVANEVLKRLQPTADTLAPGATIDVLNEPAEATGGPDGFRATGAARLLGTGPEGGFSGRAASTLLSQLLAGGDVYSNATAGETEYEVFPSRELPTISIKATGTNERDVITTIQNVFNASNGTLDEVAQIAGFNAAAAEARPLSQPAGAEKETKGIFRSLLALLALTGALAVGCALALEAWLQREFPRKPRRPRDVSSSVPTMTNDQATIDTPTAHPVGSQSDHR